MVPAARPAQAVPAPASVPDVSQHHDPRDSHAGAHGARRRRPGHVRPDGDEERREEIRRLYHDRILAGFAGSAADSFALFSRFEAKLEQFRGNLERSAVELARDWRTDRALRRLEAMLIVADREAIFLLSGTGDLIQPDDGIVAIGSGGPYALAAARALARNTGLSAREVAERAMAIAAEICIYTNDRIVIEEL